MNYTLNEFHTSRVHYSLHSKQFVHYKPYLETNSAINQEYSLWDVTPCSLVELTEVSEEPGACIFRVEEINVGQTG
jgi:hypothetical protein